MPEPAFTLSPAADAAPFYSGSPAESRCIGHLRMDFGSGDEFWTTWHPHAAHAYNDAAFKAELNDLMNMLRQSLFRDRARMARYIADHPAPPLEAGRHTCGYSVRTKRYEYFIRCMPEPGDYNAYVYCYLREKS